MENKIMTILWDRGVNEKNYGTRTWRWYQTFWESFELSKQKKTEKLLLLLSLLLLFTPLEFFTYNLKQAKTALYILN